MKIDSVWQSLKAVVLAVCIAASSLSQPVNGVAATEEAGQTDAAMERSALLNELQFLDRETLRFNDPLAIAFAKAEIADAAWQLDRSWAKKLLRGAYELALPETDQTQDRPAGSIPSMPDAKVRSQQKVRKQVLSIARRDKEFAGELVRMETERLAAYEKQYASAVLADQSLVEGDVKAAADYILQGIKADPTQTAAPGLINAIAQRDRELADRLILFYISELRKFPISSGNQSDIRTFIILSGLVKPYLYDPSVNREPVKLPSPSQGVMRAYIDYMLEALSLLERKEPGYLQRRRLTLLSLWVPLQQYAPDLSSAFLNLDSLSRREGDKSPLPTITSIEESGRSRYERRVKDGLNSDQPSEATIYAAISKGDFDKARKMIDKLADATRKKQLSDMVIAEETISLATKGKIYEAENLAGSLNHATFILRVYPVLLKSCAGNQDQLCLIRLVHQALKQVKVADTSPLSLPEGIPASAVASDQRFDLRLSFIGKLAMEVLPISDELAFHVLDEFVSVANSNSTETDQARIGSDISVFKNLAPKDEIRAQQAAYSLGNPVQRVLALAAIYQWKVNELIDPSPKSDK